VSDDRHQASECLDAETLAAFMDGRLEPRERAAVEAHLADCEDCYEVWMEAGLARESIEGQVATVSSRSRWTAGVALLAASVLVAVGLWPSIRGGGAEGAINDLVAAVGSSRFSEARLSFDFAWGAAPSVTRGDGV
jgi:predicted anti-sigma-YlaC factor YlaD